MDHKLVEEMSGLLLNLCKLVIKESKLGDAFAKTLLVAVSRIRMYLLNGRPGWKNLVPILNSLFDCMEESVRLTLSTLPPLFPSLVDARNGNENHFTNDQLTMLLEVHDLHEAILISEGRKPNNLANEMEHFLSLENIDSWSLQHLLSLLRNQNHSSIPSDLSQNHSSIPSDPVKHKVSRLLVSLLKSDSHEDDVKHFAAQCLGHLCCEGLDYDALCADVSMAKPWYNFVVGDPQMYKVEVERIVNVIVPLALRLLSTDVNLAKMSSATLKKIFEECPDACQVMKCLSQTIQLRLRPFLLKK